MGSHSWTEAKEAGHEVVHFCRTNDWKATWRKVTAMKYWGWWLLLIICIAAFSTLSLYRDTLFTFLAPYSDQFTSSSWAWIIPLLVLVIVGIPPLGGHNVTLVGTGVLFGWKEGMVIGAAGMLLGQLVCFFAFRRFLAIKALAYEAQSIWYGCIARLMRDGGIGIVTILRYSTVPTNVITALQATAGMSFWTYTVACVLALPKSLAFVYVGAIFADAADPEKAQEQLLISLAVMLATGLATLISLYVLWMRARKLYPEIQDEQAKKRLRSRRKDRKRRPEKPPLSHSNSDSAAAGRFDYPSDLDDELRTGVADRKSDTWPALPPIPPFLLQQLSEQRSRESYIARGV